MLEFGSLSRSKHLSRKRVGRIGERIAIKFLRQQGYRLIERNYRSEKGEIDLVMVQADELVFVEVKTRRSRFGGSIIFDSISSSQLRQLSKTGQNFIRQRLGKKWRGNYRFDAVGVILIDRKLTEIKLLKRFN